MPRINVLPKNIAELIAAGEVVERPASVIKELVENSIDAGATSITVEIQHGGISFLRVTDNGCGIYNEDVPKAFISHATSKISAADDLDAIYTLGFRGEALASVAAVSKVQVLTKSPEEECGTSYVIEGGEQLVYEEAGCPNGTTIIVRDIFYNVPARMKFLKKDVSEGNAVADIVDKLALSHPEISFRFIRDSKQIILTPGDNNLLSCVYSVFGSDFASTLVESHSNVEGIEVTGLVSKPSQSRGSRAMQFFFINGRYVKSRGFMSAFENAYKNSIMVGKFPACLLFIKIPANFVDINVHPTKTEVRLSDERKVNSAIYTAAKSSITELDTRPVFDMKKLTERPNTIAQQYVINDILTKKDIPAEVPTNDKKTDFWQTVRKPVAPRPDFKKLDTIIDEEEHEPDLIGNISSHKAPVAEPKKPVTEPEKPVVNSFKKPEENTESEVKQDILPKEETEPQTEPLFVIEEELKKEPDFKYIGEAFRTYILVEFDGRFCLIDKHAAHERIIFNRLKKNHISNPGQMLLQGVVVTLSKKEYDAVISNLDVFENAGFAVEDYGDGYVIVRQCPMMLDIDDISDVITEIAENLLLGKIDFDTEKTDSILHTVACKAAIKAGNKNSPAELEQLAKEVCFSDDVRYCPHGRPVLIEMSEYDLEKQFKRIQN